MKKEEFIAGTGKDFFDFWCSMDLWPLNLAVKLMFHGSMSDRLVLDETSSPQYLYADNQLLRLAITAIKAGKLRCLENASSEYPDVYPEEFVEWAVDKGFKVPPELRTLCKKERKLNSRQENKIRGQAVAAILRKNHPEFTIEQIIQHPDFLEIGKGKSVDPEIQIKWLTECGINKRGRGAPTKINCA